MFNFIWINFYMPSAINQGRVKNDRRCLGNDSSGKRVAAEDFCHNMEVPATPRKMSVTMACEGVS